MLKVEKLVSFLYILTFLFSFQLRIKHGGWDHGHRGAVLSVCEFLPPHSSIHTRTFASWSQILLIESFQSPKDGKFTRLHFGVKPHSREERRSSDLLIVDRQFHILCSSSALVSLAGHSGCGAAYLSTPGLAAGHMIVSGSQSFESFMRRIIMLNHISSEAIPPPASSCWRSWRNVMLRTSK